jgi:PAS domain S-box-containing protein
LKDKKVKFNQFVETMRHINNFRDTEFSLIKTADRLNFLISSNPAVIYTCNNDFCTTFISENVYDILGYKSVEFTGNSLFWIDNIHPNDIDNILSGLKDFFVQEYFFNESRFLHASGMYRWIRYEMKLIKNEIGEPVEIIGYMIDINDLKIVGEKFQEQAGLPDIITDEIIVTDLENNII